MNTMKQTTLFLISIASAVLVTVPATAQTITGTPGSPSATTRSRATRSRRRRRSSDLLAVRWKQWRLYFTEVDPTGIGSQRQTGMFSASAPLAGYPLTFNVEMDPHEDINVGLLADRHHGLRDSVRGLLETEFDTVFMVATEASLLEGAGRLNPAVVVLDLSMSAGDLHGLLGRIGARAPGTKVLLLSVHDERTVAESALAAGADAVVLKRYLATDLMPAVAALRAGQRYLSPGIIQ